MESLVALWLETNWFVAGAPLVCSRFEISSKEGCNLDSRAESFEVSHIDDLLLNCCWDSLVVAEKDQYAAEFVAAGNRKMKRRKLVTFYDRYTMEGKVKLSLKKSFKWIKTKVHMEYLEAGADILVTSSYQISAKSANVMPTIVAGLNPKALPLAVPRADELFEEMSEPPMVPLLLDFQIDSKYVFEAKTIQRMELLVSSSLG
ncbi:hypothetical protein Drorol1_Dr00012844 [Drosera rotundifolia]